MDQPDAQHVHAERTSCLAHFQGYPVQLADFLFDSVETELRKGPLVWMDCITFSGFKGSGAHAQTWISPSI